MLYTDRCAGKCGVSSQQHGHRQISIAAGSREGVSGGFIWELSSGENQGQPSQTPRQGQRTKTVVHRLRAVTKLSFCRGGPFRSLQSSYGTTVSSTATRVRYMLLRRVSPTLVVYLHRLSTKQLIALTIDLFAILQRYVHGNT